ncbi:serine protease inhibitor Cvsi-1-like [Mercenaria mercenaria]|uniref:serine protease inhibitor Cvsi-1-like n=1 Tax=Mercenaria mercenaria TaxID=6596 RepID=UPI001E1E038A|nr:serine protease inhibitor Cvsi-1-like [Mercenaria mercenaria]
MTCALLILSVRFARSHFAGHLYLNNATMDTKIILILAFCTGITVAIDCTGDDTTTCADVVCATGFVPTCEQNICTCNPTPDPSACSIVSDCDIYWQSHHCNKHHRECVGGHCQCAHGHGR